jgi:hypothetical protein
MADAVTFPPVPAAPKPVAGTMPPVLLMSAALKQWRHHDPSADANHAEIMVGTMTPVLVSAALKQWRAP